MCRNASALFSSVMRISNSPCLLTENCSIDEAAGGDGSGEVLDLVFRRIDDPAAAAGQHGGEEERRENPGTLSSHSYVENTILPRMIRSTLTAVIVALFAVDATAEVTRVDVRRADVGMSGYEKIVGTIYFAIDPKDPGNQVIVGLDKAPRNSAGLVEFSADLYILQPRNASRSNGVALIDVVNRGRKMTLTSFSRGGTLDPATEADLGDGFLTRQGYTLVWVGWQFDVQRSNNLMGIAAPHAEGVTGMVRAEFTPNDRSPDTTVADLVGYPLAGDGSDATLTVRDGPFGEPQDVPRGRFRLKGNVVSMERRVRARTHVSDLVSHAEPGDCRRRSRGVSRHGVVAQAQPVRARRIRATRLRSVRRRAAGFCGRSCIRDSTPTSTAARCSTASWRTSPAARG